MLHSRPLKLEVANKGDFVVPGLLLSGLVLTAALLSTQPVAMTFLAVLVIVSGWVFYTLGFSKVTGVKLTSVIFPDGTLGLESAGQSKIEGVICGPHWCTSQFAVLRYITGGKLHNMLLLSAHQNAGDYRRLLVWLRQDLFLKSEGRVQS